MRYTKIQTQIAKLKDYIEESNIIVFYGGAGTSTESGIPDYRSRHGVWTTLKQDGFDPVKIANPKYISENPEKYFKKRTESERLKPEPNNTHKVLAKMEANGKDIRVITQNVDSLHQQAGHRYVLELHGNSRDWHCMTCGREFRYSELVRDKQNVPRCYVDEGIVRPNVVYFGENANRETVHRAKRTLKVADLLIIAGTSLTTPLARRLIFQFQGKHLVIINNEPIDVEPLEPDLFIQAPVGEVFTQLAAQMSLEYE